MKQSAQLIWFLVTKAQMKAQNFIYNFIALLQLLLKHSSKCSYFLHSSSNKQHDIKIIHLSKDWHNSICELGWLKFITLIYCTALLEKQIIIIPLIVYSSVSWYTDPPKIKFWPASIHLVNVLAFFKNKYNLFHIYDSCLLYTSRCV